MAIANMEFDTSDLKRFSAAFTKWGPAFETEVNKELKTHIDPMKKDFKSFVNVSNAPGSEISRRGFPHAKLTESIEGKDYNLAIEVRTRAYRSGAKGKGNAYGYLVFPNEGRGPYNKVKQDFTGKTIEKNKKPILNSMNKIIVESFPLG